MALARRTGKATRLYGYTVEEVARFLQYDREAVRYWLRTGHLNGTYDEQLGDWRVTATELVAFLRQTSEPMPTGVVGDMDTEVDALADEIVFAADVVETAEYQLVLVELNAAQNGEPPRVRTQQTVLPAC
jgi:hypothetical protein